MNKEDIQAIDKESKSKNVRKQHVKASPYFPEVRLFLSKWGNDCADRIARGSLFHRTGLKQFAICFKPEL